MTWIPAVAGMTKTRTPTARGRGYIQTPDAGVEEGIAPPCRRRLNAGHRSTIWEV